MEKVAWPLFVEMVCIRFACKYRILHQYTYAEMAVLDRRGRWLNPF